jgi:hypothetical protein
MVPPVIDIATQQLQFHTVNMKKFFHFRVNDFIVFWIDWFFYQLIWSVKLPTGGWMILDFVYV